MTPMRLIDALHHADGWLMNSNVTKVWNWEESHHVFLIHALETINPFLDDITELQVQGKCIQQWAGLHEPKDIWDDISEILLIHYNVICEPLALGEQTDLPSLGFEP